MPSKAPSDRRKGSSKGPTKPPKPRKQSSKPTASSSTTLSALTPTAAHLEALQEILTFFQRTFAPLFASPDFQRILQAVKGHLYNRDYLAAFGSKENLEAYVIRWSPSRALCYRDVFLSTELRDVFRGNGTAEVVSIGGGAGAEVVAAAATLKALVQAEGEERGAAIEGGRDERNDTSGTKKLCLRAIDIADWTPIVDTLNEKLINSSYLRSPDLFSAEFHRRDILSVPPDELPMLIPPTTRMVTLMFVTNELFTQSRPGTLRFLLSLSSLVASGCLLLVLESAGSYSTVKVGEKLYRMELLLEHTLAGTGGDGDWEKMREEEACWFRLPEGLRYPLALENMRYALRIFRRK